MPSNKLSFSLYPRLEMHSLPVQGPDSTKTNGRPPTNITQITGA